MTSAVFHYLGPSFAVLLFARVDALGVAWLRIASAAIVFAAWRRPALRLDRTLLAWGGVLAAMNCCFYLAIARLPLGTVAAIEFLPVIVLAALGAATRRNVLALVLAVAGVYLVTGVHLAGEPLGLAFAFANALLFAAYIVLADRAAADRGIDALALAMLAAAVAVTPVAGAAAAPALGDPIALLAGAGVGISSSVIPYVTDQLALARLDRATYALMISLLPAIAVVIGVVVLAQIPTRAEAAGLLLVIAGVALHREPREPRKPAAARGGAGPSGALDDDHRRLHDRRRRLARLQVELVGRLARHERHDPEGPAGEVDLGHDAVALDVDDDAGHPVARARAGVGPALAQHPRELLGREDAVVAAALERDPAVALPAAQRVDADPQRLRGDADPDSLVHGACERTCRAQA
jgi:inner membrane transporter RhtA